MSQENSSPFNSFISRFFDTSGGVIGCFSIGAIILLAFAILYFLYGFGGSGGSYEESDGLNSYLEECGTRERFADFKVELKDTPEFAATINPLSRPKDRLSNELVQTNIESLYNQGSVFANKYVIQKEGCDSPIGCNAISIIDATTGDIVANNLFARGGIKYFSDNSLLAINIDSSDNGRGYTDEDSKDFYVLEPEGKLRLLCSIPAEDRAGGLCSPAIYKMVNMATLQRKLGVRDCDMPSQNWGVAVGSQVSDEMFWE